MDRCYDVILLGKKVGTVKLMKQGLYYQIDCFCSVPMYEPYNLMLVCDHKEVNLGLCIPYKNGFGIKTRIKASQIRQGDYAFLLIPRDSSQIKQFYPVHPDQPFGPLDRLADGYFAIQGGQVGIMIPDHRSTDSSNPTGQ